MSIEKPRATIIIMEKRINYQINQLSEGQSVEQFLRSKGYSKHLIIHLKQTDLGLTVDGKPVYTTFRLAEGELLSVLLREQEVSEKIAPAPLSFAIVYEDEDILVVNKPAGMPVHPSQGNYGNTLANAVAYYYAQKGEAIVYRAVNRLDRDTTGLMIIAKHMLSASALSFMVKERTIHREYLAAAAGKLTQPGVITAPIARLDGSTIERCVDFTNGEFARTHYEPVRYSEAHDCTLVRLWLDTGRTHQIRVHLKYIGHPLLGDFLYHPDFRLMKRQALHSAVLRLRHPITDEPLRFQAPLPDDMKFLAGEETLS